MQSDIPPANPYRPLAGDDLRLAPFAGRQKAFDHLHTLLADPTRAQPTVFLGGRDTGKTALLLRFGAIFDETALGVYVPLQETALDSEADWLQALAASITEALVERQYSLTRLADMSPPNDDWRGWFINVFLPEVMTIIRRHRRLVLLLDDADELVKFITRDKLPADSPAYLHSLLERYPQMNIVLTLDATRESDIERLAPLVSFNDIFRLLPLTPEDMSALLREPVAGLYSVTAETSAAVQAATGGSPRLSQRFGFHLFRQWEARPGQTTLTPEAVKAVTKAVYAQSEDEFRAAWDHLNRAERLVLTAISSLLYDDPLRKVDAAGIAAWLVETDYPMDTTGIHAAIRGLEYAGIVNTAAGHIALNAGLMQTWLLEHARLDLSVAGRRVGWRIAVLILAAIIVGLILITTLRGDSANGARSLPQATVTLATNP
jgi:hypothetical protein